MPEIVDFKLKFTYVVAGWEGSVHDARVLLDAQGDLTFRFMHLPMSKFNCFLLYDVTKF